MILLVSSFYAWTHRSVTASVLCVLFVLLLLQHLPAPFIVEEISCHYLIVTTSSLYRYNNTGIVPHHIYS